MIHAVWVLLVGFAVQYYVFKGLGVGEYKAYNLATEVESRLPPTFVFNYKIERIEMSKNIIKGQMKELRAKKKLEAKVKAGGLRAIAELEKSDKKGLIVDKMFSIAEESNQADTLKSRSKS